MGLGRWRISYVVCTDGLEVESPPRLGRVQNVYCMAGNSTSRFAAGGASRTGPPSRRCDRACVPSFAVQTKAIGALGRSKPGTPGVMQLFREHLDAWRARCCWI